MRINTIAIRLVPVALLVSSLGAYAKSPSLVSLFETASNNNAAYQSQRLQIQADLDQSKIAVAGILPTAGVSVTSSRTISHTEGLPIQGYNGTVASLKVSQPLYDAAAWAGYQESKLGEPLSKFAQQSARQSLMVQVSSAYFDVLKAVDHLEAIKLQKKAALYQLAVAKKSFEVGTATITDSKTAQASADQAAANEVAAANTLATNIMILEQLTGKKIAPLDDSIEPATTQLSSALLGSVQKWMSLAQDKSQSIAQARLALDRANLEVAKAEAGHKPILSMYATYGNSIGTALGNPYGAKSDQAAVGLTLNVPLFSGFAIQNQVKQAASLQSKAQADLDNAQETVDRGVRTAYANLQSGLAAVDSLQAAKSSAKSALEASELSYKIGVGTNNDVLMQQSNYYQIMSQLSDARFGVLLADIQLRQISGTLSIENLANTDKSLGF